MTENLAKDFSIWERLEQGRQFKASNGGYGSPVFGLRSVDGELVADKASSVLYKFLLDFLL